MTPEEKARKLIDAQLAASGWVVQTKDNLNLAASLGVAVCELSFAAGEPDYTLFADGKAIGTVEAKPAGHCLVGVEEQSTKYVTGVPHGLPHWGVPLPFCYESTGEETCFTNRLDPDPRSRHVFAFHRPETLLAWVQQEKQLSMRLREFPALPAANLWSAQIEAITNLDKSFANGRRRALIQMATGSGKTYTAVNFIYRLVKYAGARRILFLVDRGNLGEQTLKEFQQFVSPANNYKFTEEYIVQHLTSNTLDKSARVVIGTIQRIYSILKGEKEPPPDLDNLPIESAETLFKKPVPVEYNPEFPIEEFDFIITDECHRSIYNLWRQVLEYFDATLIGLTATPSKQTFGFFRQNLVMEYNHEKAVADGVNVGCDIYRINTAITQGGAKVDAGLWVDKRDRQTRKVRWEQLDEDLRYDASDLDRDVVAPDQIKTVLEAFRDKAVPEMFPGRTDLPKTLIFAKDDTHADDIVRICREVFGKGNDFCQKITYRTGFTRIEEDVKDAQGNIQKDEKGEPIKKVTWVKKSSLTPEQILSAFRNSYNPRIAVTVDMIATGTDIKPLEIVFFLRTVGSKNFFEQMKGRGVRVVSDTEMEQVNPGVKRKTRYLIVDGCPILSSAELNGLPGQRKAHLTRSYRKRNAEIATVLRLNPRCVAVVTDIERFYPSILHDLVRQRFQKRLGGTEVNPAVRSTALNLFEHLLSGFSNGKGIATGPELSHVVGDIALSEVDQEFGRLLPGRYFRYVDDIVFVLEPEEHKQALNRLNRLLDSAGLKTNPDKADTVSSDDWLSHGPDYRRVVSQYSFEALVFRLKVFLALKPDRRELLASALRENGFSIPMSRLAGAAGTSLFRRRIRLFYRRRWKVLLDALFETEKSLLDFAIAVRKGTEQRLTSLFEAGFPAYGSRRKWHVQRVRYLTNRALYLMPPAQLGFVRAALTNQPEFAETVALLKLLQNGDCSDLLEMPGAAVAAAAAILRDSNHTAQKIFLPEVLSDAATHSAGVLLLYGAAKIRSSIIDSPRTDATTFLAFCAGNAPQHRERDDFGYLDEIRCLQISHKPEERFQVLESRFSDNEAVPFEALEIGDEYFT